MKHMASSEEHRATLLIAPGYNENPSGSKYLAQYHTLEETMQENGFFHSYVHSLPGHPRFNDLITHTFQALSAWYSNPSTSHPKGIIAFSLGATAMIHALHTFLKEPNCSIDQLVLVFPVLNFSCIITMSR